MSVLPGWLAYERVQAEADTAAHMVAASVLAGDPYSMAHASRWARAWAVLDQTAGELLP